MSTPRRFAPRDADFSNDLDTIVPYLNSEAARLQVSASNISELNDRKADWDDLFPKSANPNTSTKTIRDSKNDTRNSIEAVLRAIYDDIPASVLTNNDRDTLNLPVRDNIPTPRGKMNTVPGVIVNSRTGRNIDVECRVTGDSTRPSRHPDSDAIEWRCNVRPMAAQNTEDPTPPPPPQGTEPAPAEQRAPGTGAMAFRTGIVSRAKFTVQLPKEDAGKMADMQCRWINVTDSSKNSDWSHVVSVMVMK